MSPPSTLHRLQDLEPSVDDFRASVIAGLAARRKTLPCKFFYDAEGSRLFEKICELPEYYPTRTECRILAARASDIAARLGPAVRLIEFGSGAGVKIR
ncbi:MAG TPA: L-histidine N(alpha)-methyltransferase, partial [Acetobacteraceae bacterium]